MQPMIDKPWFLYVVKCSDNSYYTGVTTDIRRRLREHNTTNRGSKYTKTRRPVKLVYSVVYDSQSEAQKAEYSFKQLTRSRKESIIQDIESIMHD